MARTKLAIALALMGAALSPSAHALGLGAIEVKSALNQPLDARIPLLAVEPLELNTLSVSLASAEAFQRAGVDRPFYLTRLKFKVVPGDKPFVHVSTEQPVKEPFVDFLLEADWARGKLVREFTLLLDPPVFGGPQIIPAAAPAPVRAPTTAAAPVAGQPVAGAASSGAAVPSASDGEARSGTYGPVGASDTLWKIAQNVRPNPAVSLNQTMVALLRANPDAFIDGDMNRLIRGSVLQVPDAARIATIDRALADREVRQQVNRWRQAVAAQAPKGRLQVIAPSEEGGERVGSAEPDGAASAPAAEVAALQQELKLARESNVSLEAENEELKAQLVALRQEVSRFERLVNVQAQQPAAATPESAQAPQAVAQPAELPAATAEPADAEKSAETQQPAEAQKPVEVAKAPAPVVMPAVPTAPETGFLDDPRNVGVLGGIALALLAIAYLLVRRRRLASSQEPLVEAQEPELDAPEAEAEPETAQAEPDSFEIAEEPAAAADDIPPDGDALSEAEVYLAYGRYDQARDLIDRALRSDPNNVALRLKLLETTALMHDVDAFASQARALHERVADADPAWQRAVEMGRELLPTDPLFAEEAAAAATTAEPDFGEFALDEEPAAAQVVAEEEAPRAEPEVEASDTFSLDFDLDPALEVADAATAPPASAVDDLQFDLDEAPLAPVEAESEPVAEGADDGLDFDIGDFKLDDMPTATADGSDNILEFVQPTQTEDLGLDQDELPALDNLDEVGVKLDLARAYLDMGDSEGARSLLDEVLTEGSNRQRQEAEDLLKQIA